MTGRASPDDWRREALRLNARYLEEIVVGWGLCPWAAQAWRAGAVARRVLLEAELEAAPVLAVIDELAAQPGTAIGLVIWPRASADAAAFGRFAETIRRLDQARTGRGLREAAAATPAGQGPLRPREAAGPPAPFLMAAFHPRLREQPPDDAASLVPFIRRTPDPTLQLVRAGLLEELARGGRDLSAGVARANFAAVQARTPGALDRALRDIHRDRDESYARLA